VVLVSAATGQPAPAGVTLVPVQTAAEMREAVFAASPAAHALVMAAAVADYRPDEVSEQKIKKTAGGLSLRLVRTADILAEAKTAFPDLAKIGFAAESENLMQNALSKLEAKDLSLIVANDITSPGSGFGTETNQVTLLFGDGRIEALPLMSKAEVAERIVDVVEDLCYEQHV
jgi:phosphopantothenoylcysteine decarboxylase / phosphopantothenate---cysteine ligase